jgi:hypothetical protein
MKGEE